MISSSHSPRDMARRYECEQVDAKFAGRLPGHEFRREKGGRRSLPVQGVAPAAAGRPKRASTAPVPAVEPMGSLPLTRHAEVRLRQRGISLRDVMIVAAFGKPMRSRGAITYALDRQDRELLLRTLPREELAGLRGLDIVAVVSSEGRLITAAHRTKRLRRDLR